jgi:succinate dehydrogenase / fumarate reductase cytochrome b subunit
MALTGLFLCLFLAGHLAGNLQLLVPNNALNFNQYALFMTSNPAVKLLSYLTYISILFHAIDGIALTIQNKKARPVGYAKTDGSSSSLASRNMAVLGTIILVFIATHMVNFWAKMHFDKNMPLMTKTIEVQGQKQKFYVGTQVGQYFPVEQVAKEGDKTAQGEMPKQLVIKNRTELYFSQADVKTADLYKDLYKLTIDFFKDAKYGLYFTIGYVLAMFALAFHLWHGFQSAFQSLGVNSSKLTPAIKFFGRAFAIVVPLLFAIIPVILHFKK